MAMRPASGRRPANPSHPLADVRPVYEDFRPISEWKQDGESDILLIYLPGFLRQHLKVSTEGTNIVRARGERLDAGNKWSRFQEDYLVPERCNIRAVRARFEGGILTITMPWKEKTKTSYKEDVAAAIPPKTLASPDTQKRSMIPRKELEESMPQKGFDDTPTKKQLMSPVQKPKESTPQKEFDDIPPKVLSPPALMTPPKEPKESIPQKGFDGIAPKVLSKPPLTAGSSGKGMDEKTISEPIITQKSREVQKDILTVPPKISTSVTSISNDMDKRDEGSEMKGKSVNSEHLAGFKGADAIEDKKPNEKNKGLADHKSAENVYKENGNEEKEMQTTATTTRTDHGLRNYKQSLVDLNYEERQLLVNIGVVVIVIVALGTYIITNTIQSGKAM